jgi:tetratricopeptide (TPR) repeat protein
VRDKAAPALDTNLLIAMGIHEALAVYGLQYVPDPTQTWSARFSNKTAVDFLQFPNQTLQYRGGDCDDLSILYNALLESVGVETAFITAPGHIFTAFAINVKPEELAQKFTRPQDFIVQNGKVWVPVEITAVSDSFVRAWDVAAQEWRKYQPTGQVQLFTTHDSWSVYEAVGFQAQGQVNLPSETPVLARFGTAEQSFVDREIKDRVASLQKAITAAPSSAILRSRLGTLYARYGMLADAEKQYTAAIALKYLPSIVNMGNVQYLKGDFRRALTYYQQALAQRPNNALVLLNAAVASQRLGNNADALAYYHQARTADPTMAATYQYLESGTTPAS